MITKLNTGAMGAAGSKSGSNTLLYIVIGVAVAYVSLKYLIKPEIDKRKAEAATTQEAAEE